MSDNKKNNKVKWSSNYVCFQNEIMFTSCILRHFVPVILFDCIDSLHV